MIRITKSAIVLAPLAARGNTDRQRLEKKYAADPAACQALGDKPLDVREGIYKDEQVKLQLRIDQHDKCCYCETRGFTATSYEAVEHFRPKGGYQQAATDPLTKPGYYWLAYAGTISTWPARAATPITKATYFRCAIRRRGRKAMLMR